MRPRNLLFLALSAMPFLVSAQSIDLGNTGNAFSISVSPANPLPGGTATVSFLSSSLDLANASIRVTANGKDIYAGSVHDVSIPLGKTGSIVIVSAVVTAGGSTYTQSVSIQPQDVVLIAEPLASVPALYPGKPGVPIEGNVRVVAIANVRTGSGAALSPAALSYSWTVDGTQIANASGIGKNTIIVASPLQYRSRDVSVTVTSGDGSLSGGTSISLIPVEPTVRIYENDPLLGIRFERALTDSYSVGTESSLLASPFSLPVGNGGPLIQWFLNGTLAETGSGVTLRPAGSGKGQASLSVVAESEDAKATESLTLLFGGKSAPNFFGL